MRKLKIGGMYKIQWMDHWGTESGWNEMDDLDHKPVIITSIGFVVDEDKLHYYLADAVEIIGKKVDLTKRVGALRGILKSPVLKVEVLR